VPLHLDGLGAIKSRSILLSTELITLMQALFLVSITFLDHSLRVVQLMHMTNSSKLKVKDSDKSLQFSVFLTRSSMLHFKFTQV